MKRFATQYLIYVRVISSRLDGFLPSLKMVNILEEDEGTVTKIGLTDFGNEFAKLKNPIMDDSGVTALSQDEKKFITDHILKNLPNESLHIAHTLNLIKTGTDSRMELNKKLRKFYNKNFPNYVNWSDAVVNTMRAGLLGRIYELGLLGKKKEGKKVQYSVSDDGTRFLEMTPDVDEISRVQNET